MWPYTTFIEEWETAGLRKNGQINLNPSNVPYKYEQCQEVTSQRLEQSKAGWYMWKDCLCAGEKCTLRVSHHSQIIMRLMILSVRADTALYRNWAFSGKCSMVVAIQQIWLYNIRECFPGSAVWIWPCTHKHVYCCFFCDFQMVMGFWCHLNDLMNFLSLAGAYSTAIVMKLKWKY